MVFKALDRRNPPHENVIFCSNSQTGLKAIVAIHSTKRGPSLGGCRMYPYKTEEQALEDVLRLSEAMSYKAALSDLDLGGGKSVIIADPEKDKTPALFRSFGLHIEAIRGRYIVAKDMGITAGDLQYVGEKSSYVIGRPVQKGGVGEPSYWTAQGVYQGIKTAVKYRLKKDSLKDVRIVVHGLGSVGSHLVKLLDSEKTQLFVFDIKDSIMKKIKQEFPHIQLLSEEEVFNTDCEVLAPCAVGSVINENTLPKLKCPIIAGGANNQLSSLSIGRELFKKGILYIPDFVINSGGLIHASSGLEPKKSMEWVEEKIRVISPTILKICEQSREQSEDTTQVALKMAKEKLKITEDLS